MSVLDFKRRLIGRSRCVKFSPMDNAAQYIKLSVKDIGTVYSRLRIIHPKAEMAMEQSIRRHGQVTPVIVGQPDGKAYELVDGFKRLRAFQKLGHEYLSAKILEGKDRALKAAILFLNMKVRSIDDLEQALIIQSFYKADGLNQVEIAALLGRHKSWVCRRLSLVERLCDEVIEQMRLGLINGTVGRELARLPRGNQPQVLKTLQKYRFTVRETARLVSILLSEPACNHGTILNFPEPILSDRNPPRPRPAVNDLAKFCDDLVTIDQLCSRCLDRCRRLIMPDDETHSGILSNIGRIEAGFGAIRQQLGTPDIPF